MYKKCYIWYIEFHSLKTIRKIEFIHPKSIWFITPFVFIKARGTQNIIYVFVLYLSSFSWNEFEHIFHTLIYVLRNNWILENRIIFLLLYRNFLFGKLILNPIKPILIAFEIKSNNCVVKQFPLNIFFIAKLYPYIESKYKYY